MHSLTGSPHRRVSASKKRSGFTLVELVVAMAILGIVVLAVYGAITTGFNSIRLARENLRATQILVEKMEAIRLYSWDQITEDGFIPKSFEVPYDVNPRPGAGEMMYQGTVSVSRVPLHAPYADDLRMVTLQLVWKSGHLRRQREISTYVCRTGLQNYLY